MLLLIKTSSFISLVYPLRLYSLELQDVTKSTECTSGFFKAGLDVFMGTIVTAYKTVVVCEIDGDWGAVYGIYVHRLGLFLVDAQTSSICCIV